MLITVAVAIEYVSSDASEESTVLLGEKSKRHSSNPLRSRRRASAGHVANLTC